jgi:GNAT superfamily N-acetyltransferase
MATARPADRGDRSAVAAAVAAAFAHDPAWIFLLGDDYDRLAPGFAGALFDPRVDSGHVWVTNDVASTAMWVAPGAGAPTPASEKIWSAFRASAGHAVGQRLDEYQRALDAVRTTTPHWYLGVLATHPDAQGQGRASTVIAPVLQEADRLGLDCCLETSTLANKAFYQRRGFTDVTDVEIAGGPPTWWLLRPPQSKD